MKARNIDYEINSFSFWVQQTIKFQQNYSQKT